MGLRGVPGRPFDGLGAAQGVYAQCSVVQKFGIHVSISAGFLPVSYGGIYRTPTSVSVLEVVSDSAQDSGAGTGARSLHIEGVDVSGNYLSQAVSLNGTTAVTVSAPFLRVHSAHITGSGTYATAASASQAGSITIRGLGGGQTWAVLGDGTTGFARGRSQIAAYTVPNGKVAYIPRYDMHVEAAKTATVLFFERANILDITAPFAPMRIINEVIGASGLVEQTNVVPWGPFTAGTDIGFMAKVLGGAIGAVAVDFEILLFDA